MKKVFSNMGKYLLGVLSKYSWVFTYFMLFAVVRLFIAFQYGEDLLRTGVNVLFLLVTAGVILSLTYSKRLLVCVLALLYGSCVFLVSLGLYRIDIVFAHLSVLFAMYGFQDIIFAKSIRFEKVLLAGIVGVLFEILYFAISKTQLTLMSIFVGLGVYVASFFGLVVYERFVSKPKVLLK